jgi:hypothetical protein
MIWKSLNMRSTNYSIGYLIWEFLCQPLLFGANQLFFVLYAYGINCLQLAIVVKLLVVSSERLAAFCFIWLGQPTIFGRLVCRSHGFLFLADWTSWSFFYYLSIYFFRRFITNSFSSFCKVSLLPKPLLYTCRHTQLIIFMWNHCFHSWQLCALLCSVNLHGKSIKSHTKPIKMKILL